ncbi:MAG: hypothetical protein ACJ8DI_04435 [Ktedonobacteraceae bacterium]
MFWRTCPRRERHTRFRSGWHDCSSVLSDKLLALRNAVCNRRWNEMWQAARRQRQQSRQKLRGQRIQARSEQALRRLLTLWLWWRPSPPRSVAEPAPESVSSAATTAAQPSRGPRRPAANHPWRRPVVVRPTEAFLAKK